MNDAKSGIWATCELQELLASDFPGAWGSDPGSKQANVSVLRSTNIDDEGHIDYSTGAKRYFVSRDLARKRLSNGDILLESSGGGPGKPVGRVAIFRSSDDEIYASSNFFRTLRPRPIVDSSFLAWYLQWTYLQPSIWQLQQQTTGIINLKYKDYLRQSIAFPEVQEQRRIAEILDTADEAIQSTELLIAKLEQVKKGLLRDLIGADVGTLHRLDDAAKVTVGHVGPTEDFYTNADKGVVFLRTGNITERGISLKNLRYVTEAFHTVNRKSALYTGDVVISRVGYTGTAAVIPEIGEANCANMIIVRPSNMLNSSYLRLLFESELVTGQVSAFTAGSAQPVLNIRLVQRLRIPVPSLTVQADITDAVAHIDARIVAEERNVAKRRLLKRGLMDDLLTRRVRVGASG